MEEQQPQNNKQFNKQSRQFNQLEKLGLKLVEILTKKYGHQLSGDVTQITVTYEGVKYDLTKNLGDSRIFVTLHKDPKPKRKVPKTQKPEKSENPE